MKKTTEKVSYLNYCLYICGVMKDDGFHRTKTKPNEKLLLLKLKNGKAYARQREMLEKNRKDKNLIFY